MKRIFLLLLMILFLSIHIYSLDYYYIEEDMVWKVKNGNPREPGLENLEKSFEFLKDSSLKGTDLAYEAFFKGDEFLKFRIFVKGESLNGGTTFGGKNPNTYPIVKKGKITIGFDKALSKYVEIFILKNQMVVNIEELTLMHNKEIAKIILDMIAKSI